MRGLILFLLIAPLWVYAQSNERLSSNAALPSFESNQNFRALTFSTPAYRNEVLKRIIGEANSVAKELNLEETIPIVESNLVAEHIVPPRLSRIGIGSVTTSNYVYYITVGDKFSSLVNVNYEQVRKKALLDYSWSTYQLNTNMAYQLATQWLEAISVDVKALNRDCEVAIHAWKPEGQNSKYFVPLYRVYWIRKLGGNRKSMAGVEFLEPTKSIQQIYVKNSDYILRNPIIITNIDFLLSQTNHLPD